MLNHEFLELTVCFTCVWILLGWEVVVFPYHRIWVPSGLTQRMGSFFVPASLSLNLSHLFADLHASVYLVEILFFDPKEVFSQRSADRKLSGPEDQESWIYFGHKAT